MKIAFIYSYRPEEIWSTPLSLATEFQSRGWEVQIFSLLSEAGNYTDAGIRMMFDQIRGGGYSPDIIFYLDWGRFDSPYLDKDLYSKAFWIQEAGDDPQNYEKNFPKSDRFNLILTPDYVSCEHYKAGFGGLDMDDRNAIWFTHWADTVIHHPMNITPQYTAVSTRGYGSSPILDHLSHTLGGSFRNKSGYDGIAHSEALQQGKIVVQHSRWGEITRRIFEAMACGRMVLTDELDSKTRLDTLFKEGEEIVFYDSFEECLDMIQYYNVNAKEREAIALAGKNAVLKSHTQYQRVNTILEQFRLWKESH